MRYELPLGALEATFHPLRENGEGGRTKTCRAISSRQSIGEFTYREYTIGGEVSLTGQLNVYA